MSSRLRGRPGEPRLFRARLRGITGWLPGALTLGNLLAGHAAILLAGQGRLLAGTVLVLVAGVLDGLDGRVARLVGATSDFGEELDSLADAVSFAVAPSIIAFHAGLQGLGRIGWAACFVFAACGVIRLARFNAAPHDHHWFIGLPIPSAAAAATCPLLVTGGEPVPARYVPAYAVAIVGVALLMVSAIRYRTFKDIRFGRRPYRILALWALLLAGLVARAEWMIPGLVGFYLLSPLWWRRRTSLRAGTRVARPREGKAGDPAAGSPPVEGTPR